MTSDDLEMQEVRIVGEFRMISQILEAKTATGMEVDSFCQRQNIVAH